MAKKDETTKLELWLSTGSKICVYYNGSVSQSIDEDLRDCIRLGIGFYVYNWDVEQIVIQNADGKTLFTQDAGAMDLVDVYKIIGWSTS